MKNQYLFLIVIIWVLVVVSEDLIQNTILSNYFISPLENPRIRTAYVRKSISLQRFRFITTVLRSSGNSSRSKLDSYLAIQWRLLPENHILVHLFLKSSFQEVAIGADLF